MRLWHKALIPVLPRQQLLGQWRECCAIAKNIAEKGTPGHMLVNKIMNYPKDHFAYYATLVADEIERRGYKCDYSKFAQWWPITNNTCTYNNLFKEWHNDKYFIQCYYNLQEKHDCGGMTDAEWSMIVSAWLAHIYGRRC